jgi:hypothetical protein
MAEAERLRQSLLADAGRGDLLKTIIAYRLEQTGRAPSERSADDPVTHFGEPPVSLSGTLDF